MKAMILAAGMGVRMRPITEYLPKALVEVNGIPLIEYHLKNLAKAGIHDVVINTHHLRERLEQVIGDGSRFGVNVTYSIEEELLETGGGVHKALPLLGDEPFILLNSDTVTDFPFETLNKPLNGLAHLVLVDKIYDQEKGDFSLQDGFIADEEENKLSYAGIAVYHPKLFENCTPGYFPVMPLIREKIAKHQVSGEYYAGSWYVVDTAARLEYAEQALCET